MEGKGKRGEGRKREEGEGVREGRGRKLVPHFLDESYAPVGLHLKLVIFQLMQGLF